VEKISVVGIGKLGLCLALNLENSGFDVCGVDINDDYVAKVNDKTLKSCEPGVDSLLQNSTNFFATTSLEESVSFSDTLFVVVSTPSLKNGGYDHTQVESIVSGLEKLPPRKNPGHFIVCCTTMPGYCETIEERLRKINYYTVYNPEFIAQGEILKGQTDPDFVLIGKQKENETGLVEEIYNKMVKNNAPTHTMSLTEAEITKISLNCFLTTKIAFANMIGDLATEMNSNPDRILRAIGQDQRVGHKYLGYGFGFGGPCFPRDNRALGLCCKENGIYHDISKASDDSNFSHLEYQVRNFVKNNTDKSKEILISDVTYKKNSNLIVESQQLKFAVGLAKEGFPVTIKEGRNVIEKVQKLYGDLFKYEIV